MSAGPAPVTLGLAPEVPALPDRMLWNGRRCVVAGGLGGVGSVVVELLADAGAAVSVIDVRSAPVRSPARDIRCLTADLSAPGPAVRDELEAADAVVLALPDAAAMSALDVCCTSLRPGALLVDTLSAKTGYLQAVRSGICDVEILSINPMFAPSLDMDDRPIAAIALTGGSLSEAFLSLLVDKGARVVPMAPEEHDRVTSATQALTHAAVLSFALAITTLSVDLRQLARVAPPPHTAMLELVARICSSGADTYWDIQAANPFAGEARTALTNAARELGRLVDSENVAGFEALLAQAKAWFGPDLGHWAQRCASTFDNSCRGDRHLP